MRLALLGADDEALDLVEWAVGVAGHQLAAAFDVGPLAQRLRAVEPGVRLDEDWESLLLGSQVEAVIVARGQARLSERLGVPDDERRADQLRKLAQAAVPMLVFCPACEAIVGFEIEMIRRDSQGVILPVVPGHLHPALWRVEQIVSAGSDSPIGKIEQMSLQREQQDRSRAAVLCQFARDVSLLRRLLGNVRSVTATGPAAFQGRDPLGPKPKELATLSNLSVHLAGESGLSARWSIGPVMQQDSARLSLIGDRGQATVDMPTSGEWSLCVAGEKTTLAHFNNGYEEVFQLLSRAVAGDSYDSRAWLNACRDQEAAEAIDRSLLRGRTIELFNEEHTEEQSFKGVMAMGGCLLLVLAMGVVGLAVVVEGLQLPIRNWALWRFWPAYLLVPIVLFLLMQLLQLAVPKTPKSGSHEPDA